MRAALAVLCVALSGAAAGDGPVYESATLESALAAPAASAVARDISAASDARALLEQLDAVAALPEPARTMLTFDVLLSLSAAAPEATAMATLERHAREAMSIRLWNEHEGRRVAVAAYDTGAAARFTLRAWRRSVARERAAAEIRDGMLMREKSTQTDPATMSGYADALGAASIEDLRRVRSHIVSALADGEPVEALVLILVERLHDTELAGLLLARAPAEFVVRSLGTVAGAFPPDEAFHVLADAVARPDVASAVVLRIGESARTVPEARAWLHAQLGVQPHGASAAAALARIADAAIVATLAELLQDAHDPLVRARAALALKLSGRDDARAALMEFVDSGEGPEALRRAVVQWLR